MTAGRERERQQEEKTQSERGETDRHTEREKRERERERETTEKRQQCALLSYPPLTPPTLSSSSTTEMYVQTRPIQKQDQTLTK